MKIKAHVLSNDGSAMQSGVSVSNWVVIRFVCLSVVLCTVMAGATDAPLEQGRINRLSVCLSV